MLDFIEGLVMFRVVSIIATIVFVVQTVLFICNKIKLVKERKNEIFFTIILFISSYRTIDTPIERNSDDIAIYRFI